MFEVEKAEKGLLVRLTGEAPPPISSVVVLDIKGSPDVPNQNITQNKNGVLILRPEDCDLENRGYNSINHAELIRNKELSYITWKETRTWMEWPVEITDDNVFYIYATVATGSEDNKIIIEAGEQKAEFQLPNTNGLGNFKKIKIGTIKISKGISILTVKGDKDKWQECYISNIEFRKKLYN